MSIHDYAHHNEDAALIWWMEEGQYGPDDLSQEDFYDRDSYIDDFDFEE